MESFKGLQVRFLLLVAEQGCICLTIECDSLPSLKVHRANPTVCTQRKIKSAHPSLWSSVLKDLSRVCHSPLHDSHSCPRPAGFPDCLPIVCVHRLIRSSLLLPTFLWRVFSMTDECNKVNPFFFVPLAGSAVSSNQQRHIEANL